jgi:hypothetical protein
MKVGDVLIRKEDNKEGQIVIYEKTHIIVACYLSSYSFTNEESLRDVFYTKRYWKVKTFLEKM